MIKEDGYPLKIAYASIYDARSIAAWSGTGYHMARALTQARADLVYLGPLRSAFPPDLIAKKLLNRLTGKTYLRSRNPTVLRWYATQAEQRLRGLDSQIVFSPSSLPVAYLRSSRPIVFWTDATFAGLVGYYPGFSSLAPISIREGNQAEQSALDRCRYAIFSSEWAAQTALQKYGAFPDKVKVIPFGANLEGPHTEPEIMQLISARPTSACKILFVGVDWQRKGGNIAIEVVAALNDRHIPAELHVVGCMPPGQLPGFVKTHGFVSKETEVGKALLNRLFSEAHFLILPTRADCTPIVIPEANAFSVPALTSNTGGLGSLIRDGVNGQKFALDAPAIEYAEYVSRLWADRPAYDALALSSFREFFQRLNWKIAGAQVKALLESAVGENA